MAAAATAPLHITLPAFEGPLDLLLHLIRRERVDIYDIPIAEITRQYMEYLAAWEALDLAVAGEYLLMAATLVEIKSRLLLPQPPPAADEDAEEDPRAALVRRLVEYEQFSAPVDELREREELRRLLYFRGALEDPDDYLSALPDGALDAGQLVAALRRALSRAGVDGEPLTAVLPRRRVNLRMAMAEVLRKVRARPDGMEFADLFDPPCSRAEIVLAFLAVLELLRLGRIRAEQGGALGEIVLYPAEAVVG